MVFSFFRKTRGQPITHQDINTLEAAIEDIGNNDLRDVVLNYPDSGSAALVSNTGNILTRALRLATNALSGLLSAADKAKIDKTAFGADGELLLGPDFTSFVGQKTGSGATADAHLRASGRYAFVEAPGNTHATANAYWDGTNWLRYNIGAAAFVFIVNAAGELDFWWAAAGANPIAWNQGLDLRLDFSASATSIEGSSVMQSLIVASRYTHIAGNLALAPGGASWNRINTAQPALLMRIGEDGNIVLFTAPAGANPATLTAVGNFTPYQWALTVAPPRAHAIMTAGTQSIANGVVTPITMGGIIDATAGAAPSNPWNAGSPARLTVPQSGSYEFGGTIVWTTIATVAPCAAFMRINGSALKGGNSSQTSSSFAVRNSCHVRRYLNAGDYVELCAYQTTGFTHSVVQSGEETAMYLNYVGT